MRHPLYRYVILIGTAVVLHACGGGTAEGFSGTTLADGIETGTQQAAPKINAPIAQATPSPTPTVKVAPCTPTTALPVHVLSDVSPTTWAWNDCTTGSGKFRVSLDGNTFGATVSGAHYAPPKALATGMHTLTVQSLSRSNEWGPDLNMNILVVDPPNVNGAAYPMQNYGYYAYPTANGRALAPGALEVYGTDNILHPADVDQGYIGDCYYMASVAAIAWAQPNYLPQLVRPWTGDQNQVVTGADGYDLYHVTLFAKDDANNYQPWEYITDGRLPTEMSGTIQTAQPVMDAQNGKLKIGAPLLEKAYALLNPYNSTDKGYYAIGEGGWSEIALPALLGVATLSDPAMDMQTLMQSALANNTALAFSTGSVDGPYTFPSGATLSGGNYFPAGNGAPVRVIESHLYSFVGLSGNNAMLRNPWGNAPDATGGVITIPITDLAGLFWDVGYNTVPQKPTFAP